MLVLGAWWSLAASWSHLQPSHSLLAICLWPWLLDCCWFGHKVFIGWTLLFQLDSDVVDSENLPLVLLCCRKLWKQVIVLVTEPAGGSGAPPAGV